MAFDAHPNEPVVCISSKGVARWIAGPLPADRHKYINGRRYYLFDRASALDLLSLVIHHAYIRVGDRLFRQQQGIPMGVNPATYFANIYLFTFEIQFMAQLIQVHNTSDGPTKALALRLMQCFQWANRYIDDLFIIAPHSATFSSEYLGTNIVRRS